MTSKLTLLIGHRGVGKTSLLKRIDSYCTKYKFEADTIDLDSYIESNEGKKIKDIFSEDGEKKFRLLEKKYLLDIVQKINKKTIISIGAGFMGPYPEYAKIIFVKRDSDENGRTFLDRPRLNSRLSAFEEYKDIYLKREQHYSGQADLTFVLQEGLKENNLYEETFFGFIDEPTIGGVYTLLPQEVTEVDTYLNWGVDKIELRTDYFNEKELLNLIDKIPEEKLLLSIRDNKNTPQVRCMDWALEQGDPDKHYTIISSHNNDLGMETAIEQLEKHSTNCEHLKLAVNISSLEELKTGHEWHLKNPTKNCFLPISNDGKYSWYRLVQKNKIFPNFFKTTILGSAKDQPYFHEWVNHSFEFSNGFAAIIGDPVGHSWTPNEHESFFSKYQMPVVKINLSEEEMTNEYFNFIYELGLRAAAITSPLKLKIGAMIGVNFSGSINTVVRSNNEWRWANTDVDGFQVLAGHLKNKKGIVLWGGGGVINSVKSVLPQVSSYSSRTGTPRDGESRVLSPCVVIWAIGRNKHRSWPNPDWAPSIVVDLNYSEDSPGKEYALMVGAEYISGASMFMGQAKKQQEFWSKHLQ